MRSRTARLIISALVLIAIGVSAFFVIQSEQQISQRRASLRAFDLHAREATVALADLRASQQAYVAEGQGVAFWMPKVAALSETAVEIISNLIASAPGPAAHESLTEAAATIAAFEDVDRRAREYLRSGQQLMAGDVVFTEGGETAAEAARQVESARLAEHQAVDASEASLRRREAIVLAAAAGASTILAFLLVLVPVERASADESETAPSESNTADGELTLNHFRLSGPHSAGQRMRPSVPALKTAAELCTELGRVNDIDELKKLLARAAAALDAGGLIIWIGNAAGADLRPVLAHGYASQAIARMPPVPRSADNAAAKAYRTGALQIVLARPGTSNGAVVAPLLSPEGCIGALTAEINDRGETSDTVQALAAIFAAQLAGVLAPSVTASTDALPGQVAI